MTSTAGEKRKQKQSASAGTAVLKQQNDYSNNRAAAYRMLAVEAGLIAIFALLLFVIIDATTARSSFMGGLTFVLPNALFTGYVFRQSAADSAHKAVRWLYVGEGIKLLSTVIMFAACFMWIRPLHAGFFFVTYGLLLVINMAGNAYLTRS